MRRIAALCVGAGLMVAAGLIVWAAEAATLRITADDLVLLVTLKDRTELKVTSKPAKIKAGEYEVKKFSFYKRDDDKKTWEIRCDDHLGTLSTIVAAPGQEKILDPGPPLIARCQPWQNGDQVSITIRVVGKYSEHYDVYAYQGKRKPKPPVLTLKDQEGNVLVKTVMEVGPRELAHYAWKYGDYRGPYKIEAEMDLGPFEWTFKPITAPEVKEK